MDENTIDDCCDCGCPFSEFEFSDGLWECPDCGLCYDIDDIN